jgi:hypothetical protein
MKKMTTKQYLKPNAAIRPPVPSGETWTPTAQSGWKRTFKFTSKGSVRGFSIIDGKRVNFESRAEYKAASIIRARPDTLRIIEQSPKVEYVDADGKFRTHVFDLQVFRIGGSIVATDVTPAALVETRGIRELHALIAPQISRRVATSLLVFTERMYTRVDLYNAELMHAVGRQHFPEDDEAILTLVGRMKGPAPIADLVSKSRLNGYGFNAIVRAIATGHLTMTERRRIDYDAVVAPVRKNGGAS